MGNRKSSGGVCVVCVCELCGWNKCIAVTIQLMSAFVTRCCVEPFIVVAERLVMLISVVGMLIRYLV